MIKIIRTHIEEFEFDLDEERERLASCFKEKQLKRQVAILDACFVEKDLEKTKRLFNKLPRCPEHECSEKEYMGKWISVLLNSDWGMPERTASNVTIEIREMV